MIKNSNLKLACTCIYEMYLIIILLSSKAQWCWCCPLILYKWSHLCFRWYLTQVKVLSIQFFWWVTEVKEGCCFGSLVSDPVFNVICYLEAAGLQTKKQSIENIEKLVKEMRFVKSELCSAQTDWFLSLRRGETMKGMPFRAWINSTIVCRG